MTPGVVSLYDTILLSSCSSDFIRLPDPLSHWKVSETVTNQHTWISCCYCVSLAYCIKFYRKEKKVEKKVDNNTALSSSLLMCLLSNWASKQKPSPKYSYG